MDRLCRLDHLIFGLDLHCLFLAAGVAVVAVVADEEVQLGLACALALAGDLKGHRTAASVEWPVADKKRRLVDASVTYSASADFVAASYAFDSSEDYTVVGKNVGVAEDAAVLYVVDDAATVAFADDAVMRIVADDVAIVDAAILDDASAVAAVLSAAGVDAAERVGVADDGLVRPAVVESVVVLASDVVAAIVAFVLLDYTVGTEFGSMQRLWGCQLLLSLNFDQTLLTGHVAFSILFFCGQSLLGLLKAPPTSWHFLMTMQKHLTSLTKLH